MKIFTAVILLSLGMTLVLKANDPLSISSGVSTGSQKAVPQNPFCNYAEFEKIVVESAKEYEQHRLTEAQFLDAMHEKGVVLLDARSPKHFAELHIAGAVNLPFTEFSANSLGGIIPRYNTKVLIYCNNNFLGDQVAMLTRALRISPRRGDASLNTSTYVTLKAFGYRNIYILGPLLNLRTTKILFEGTRAAIDTKPKIQ